MFTIKMLLFPALLISVFFFSFAILSFYENEKRAAWRSLALAILSLAFHFGLHHLFLLWGNSVVIGYYALFLASLLALFLPYGNGKYPQQTRPLKRFDERRNVLSRRLLVRDKQKFDAYYKEHPEDLAEDEKFRAKPGLLSPKSSHYHRTNFAATDAHFMCCELLYNGLDGEVNPEKSDLAGKELSDYLKSLCQYHGAVDAGICELKDYHLYSHHGRLHNYGEELKNEHRYALAIIVEMDAEMTAAAPASSIVMESSRQYLQSGTIATVVAAFLRNLGHSAKAHVDGRYDIICPLVGRDAGMGEIGRMGLLMHPQLGPRHRIAVVTTDAPLLINQPLNDPTMLDFCEKCKKCAQVCPSASISKEPMQIIDGSLRWKIDQAGCLTYWNSSGTDCGRCMAVCPYSHANNRMHNIIRFGLRQNPLFRSFALLLDDFMYGRKPKAHPLPKWAR